MTIVLIVEDDAFIREAAEMMIQDWGYGTLSAGSADEALSVLLSAQVVDALFTDIRLQTVVLGGCELARQAIDLRPEMRVLYTTGNYVGETLRRQFVEGAQCLRKPYMAQQLQQSLKELLAPSLKVAHS